MVLRFNGRAARAERWLAENSSAYIVEITNDQRNLVRAYLTNALVDRVNPRTAALDVVGRINRVTGKREGGILGLTSSEAANLQRAYQELRSGDPAQMSNYLTRKLRDRRSDSIVRRALRGGKPVNEKNARAMISRMQNRALKARGDRIARTEGITALRAGRHEGFAQLLDTGAITEEQIKRTWDSSGEDGRTRDDHLAMDGQVVSGMREPFVAPDGSRMLFPGDKSLGAPAKQTIHCRCHERVRIDFIGEN